MTVGLSSEVCLLPTSKISKTQYFLIIYACKHIILGIINTTIFLCVVNFTQICVSWNLEKISRFTKIPKILNFPGSSKIYNFHENRDPTFPKFPGILVGTMCKSARIYVFPEIVETKSRFFLEKCRPQFLVFVEIWGHSFLEFTGIHVDKITKNARIHVFHWILETQRRNFPGNFHEILKSWIFLNFRKPWNFGERVTSTKKVPNFQFSPGFTLNFV